MRLDKFISSQTSLSRSDVKKLIKHGAVTVDKAVAASCDMQIFPETSEIVVDGQALSLIKSMYIIC